MNNNSESFLFFIISILSTCSIQVYHKTLKKQHKKKLKEKESLKGFTRRNSVVNYDCKRLVDDAVIKIKDDLLHEEMGPVVDRIEDSHFRSIVIGVAGGSGSGKTTLSRAIVESLGEDNITYISHDSYYKDISHLTFQEREKQNFDHPDALDSNLLVKNLEELLSNKVTDIPIYDFSTHSRCKEVQTLYLRPIILVEGILIFHEQALFNLMDIKIFVDTDDDIRLIRRIQRDIVERKREIDKIISQYLRTVRPMHIQFVQPSKRNADIIVPFGLNSVALDLVISKLKRVLKEARIYSERQSRANLLDLATSSKSNEKH